MKIKIGQVFRIIRFAKGTVPVGSYFGGSYIELTKGRFKSQANVIQGISAFKNVKEPGKSFKRIPAIILHSNPFKEGTEITPWVDVIEPDLGYALYNGDNRKGSILPLQSRGNAILSRAQLFYTDPELRKFAPPVLLFTQCEINGNRKGYREFSGYGIPTHFMLVSQREKEAEGYFTNLVIELALFRLDTENEEFDWNWIDLRRDSSLPADTVLKAAPSAWKLWVQEGEAAIEKCRRRIARHSIVSTREQLDYPETDKALVAKVAVFYSACPHAFEGLASLIAERVVGQNCKRGWITKRSADGGVDFVCRVDLGSEFSRVPVVLLGQAKCPGNIQGSVSGRDIARLVARLQRGWVGVFVTTGIFSRATQEELHTDRYPVILINGKRLAKELRTLLITEGITLTQLLEREKLWYETNLQPMEPGRILDDTLFGTRVVFNNTPSSVN
jgi:hypothetical protein